MYIFRLENWRFFWEEFDLASKPRKLFCHPRLSMFHAKALFIFMIQISQKINSMRLINCICCAWKLINPFGNFLAAWKKVQRSETLGRHLIANKKKLHADELIFQESPIVFGPQSKGGPVCIGCTRELKRDPKTCEKCGWPVCGTSCSMLQVHQAECDICTPAAEKIKAYANSRVSDWMYDAILPMRMLLLKNSAPEKWKMIEEMTDHIDTVESRGDDLARHVEKLTNFLKNTIFKDSDVTEADAKHVIGAVDVNGLEVRKEDLDYLAIYPYAILMEHSCIPNTKHTFENHTLAISVRAAVPIEPGDHLTTMYTHALWGTAVRRRHLWTTKNFWCSCPRCADSTEFGTCMSALNCRGCGSPVLPSNPLEETSLWMCSTPGCKTPALSASRVEEITCQFGQVVNEALKADVSVTSLEACKAKYSSQFHENHFHMLTLNHTLLQAYGRDRNVADICTTMEHAEKKLALCNKLIPLLNVIDPGASRLAMYTAVVYFELHAALVDKYRYWQDVNKKQTLGEILEALTRCQTILRDELDDPSGARLMDVVSAAFANLEQRLKGQM
ncbi:unnamed protein product [Notodromas monacha]|uniref:Protein msta n=1 Tax=Notodromas monacha TaxID=399045 RepID=A0A7R9BXK6_9CRUS|nr:unnamed protein product [Notodromas monacha]CAG0922260.1 unnamed protein product [Notodromas monacha]